MNKAFSAIAHFEGLFASFDRDRKLAEELYSPNLRDTLEIKAAIIGFSYHAKTELWAKRQFEFVLTRLSALENQDHNERMFFSECLGFLLGLFQADEINEVGKADEASEADEANEADVREDEN